jgi:hypothetical protein
VLECGPVLVGDLDCDGLLLPEWGSVWQECLLGPGQPIAEPACQEVDLDDDEDVDLGDVARFGLAQTCTPGAPGCGWADGDMVTYNQESWGGDPTQSTAAALLVAQFSSRFPTGVVVGYGSGFLMAFTSAAAILNYQPQSGAAAPLNSDLLDPSSSASGVYGGFVLALQLDVDFADSGQISGTSGLVFGDLRLCGLTTTPAYNGMTVRQFLEAMNTALGAGPAAYSYGDMAILTNEVSSAFEGGSPSLFAQQHLFDGACPCTPGAPGCGWEDGDMVSYSQDSWGGDPNQSPAAALLLANFGIVYPFSAVEVGISGPSGFSMVFTSASAILAYQPALGGPGPLNADLLDPTSTSSGVFGGFVLALRLDVDFSDTGHIAGTSGLLFGDLRLCGLSTQSLNGMTVRDYINTVANPVLGGASTPYDIDEIALLTRDISEAFEGRLPSPFAQDHLFNGPCPCTPGAPGCGWEDGDVSTYTQVVWGDPASGAGILLNDQFSLVYASSGVLEAGLSGAAGFSMLFTSAGAVLAYQPAIGNLGPLNADLIDPTATSSGAYGGEVVALILNTDFAAAGHTLGTSGLLFGDLTLCAFTSNPALNGISVNDFLAMLNSALGGGPAPYAITVLHLIAEQVNAAFSGGSPSVFAQEHLFNGACPCTPGAPGCGWQDGNMTTHHQDQWGDGTTTAGNLLTNYFATVYFSTGGLLVGLVPTFNMTFDSPQAIFDYQPALGAPAALNANLSNPTSSASGSFGGEVVALKLNVDFSQNNLLPSSANLRFGDLLICGVNPAIDGGNVSTFLGYANSALGGGSAPLTITELNSIVVGLNASFGGGAVSVFAQNNLFNGACP